MGIVAPFKRRVYPRLSPSFARSHERFSGLPLLFVALILIAGYFVVRNTVPASAIRSAPSPEQSRAQFSVCGFSARTNCVVDGDTFYFAGEKIRVADIDAPETGGAQCASEAELGARATARLRELLNQGPFELRGYQGRDIDRYGRKLRVIVRDGRSIGDALIAEGLARRWKGRRLPWCA